MIKISGFPHDESVHMLQSITISLRPSGNKMIIECCMVDCIHLRAFSVLGNILIRR